MPARVGGRPGCVRGGVGFLALALLAPFAVLARVIAKWRRGTELRLDWTEEPLTTAGGLAVRRFDVTADVPLGRETAFRSALTDTVVRIAESMRRSDDIYHFVVRYAELGETTLLPVGPQLQELGERFALALAQSALEGRTAVWLTLARRRAVAQVVDPFEYDPEAPGEPEGLLTHPAIRWGMATSYRAPGPSFVHRIVLYVPDSHRSAVQHLLERLQA